MSLPIFSLLSLSVFNSWFIAPIFWLFLSSSSLISLLFLVRLSSVSSSVIVGLLSWWTLCAFWASFSRDRVVATLVWSAWSDFVSVAILSDDSWLSSYKRSMLRWGLLVKNRFSFSVLSLIVAIAEFNWVVVSVSELLILVTKLNKFVLNSIVSVVSVAHAGIVSFIRLIVVDIVLFSILAVSNFDCKSLSLLILSLYVSADVFSDWANS